MPYKKPMHRSQAAKRIQSNFRRYRRKRRIPRHPSTDPVLTVTQKDSFIRAIPSSTTPTFEAGQIIFKLDNLDPAQYGNYTRLFKFYRLLGVKVTFVPQYIGSGTSTDPQPQLLTAGTIGTSITRDSNALAPISPVWANVVQAEGCSNLVKRYLSPQTGGRSTHVVKMKPSLNNWVRTTVNSATGNTVTIQKGRPWISTGTPGQEYYGLRWFWETQANNHPAMDLEVRISYIFQFKGVQ